MSLWGLGGNGTLRETLTQQHSVPLRLSLCASEQGDSWGQLHPASLDSYPITCLEVGTASIRHPSGSLSTRGAGPGPRCRHFPLRAQGRAFLSFLSV